jgi:hypothetical protein
LFQCIAPAVDVEGVFLMIGKTLGHYQMAGLIVKSGTGEVIRRILPGGSGQGPVCICGLA